MTDVAALFVKAQRIDLQGWLATTLIGDPTQNGLDTHTQFTEAERLGQIIVGALAEAGDAILLGTQGGHQDDRYMALLAQALQHVQAVAAGQQDVHQNQVKVLLPGQAQAFAAVVAEGHVKAAALQVRLQMRGQGRVIFDGKNPGGAAGCKRHGEMALESKCERFYLTPGYP